MQGDIFYLTKIRSRCELQKYLKIIQRSILVAMLNCCSSSQCWSMIPSLMQAWIRYPIPSLFGSFAAYCHQSFFNVLRKFIIGFGSRHAALSIRFASWPKQSCAHYKFASWPKQSCAHYFMGPYLLMAQSAYPSLKFDFSSVLMQMP